MAGRTTRSERLALAILVFAATTNAATPPFVARLYPVLDNAGCKSCHHSEGVASGTRLRFPAEGASTEVVEAFGNSLVDLVDRANPKRSLLLNKPTNRVKHTGGERIKKGSAEEKLLIDWVNRLVLIRRSMPHGTDTAAPTKSGKERRIPLGTLCRDALTAPGVRTRPASN